LFDLWRFEFPKEQDSFMIENNFFSIVFYFEKTDEQICLKDRKFLERIYPHTKISREKKNEKFSSENS